jgi:hypothetical protein
MHGRVGTMDKDEKTDSPATSEEDLAEFVDAFLLELKECPQLIWTIDTPGLLDKESSMASLSAIQEREEVLESLQRKIKALMTVINLRPK